MASAHVEIPLSGSRAGARCALVSPEDYLLVCSYGWNVWEAERPNYNGGPYAVTHAWIMNRRTTLQMHRLIAAKIAMEHGHSIWPKVDHENFNGLDNRRSNLRDGTRGNTHNQRPRAGGTSRYKGVSWHRPSQRWWARITIGGRTRSLGLYSREEDAAMAYNAEALRLFGEYAHLNEIEN